MKFIFQMDPIEKLNYDLDSTIALIKASLNKNVSVFYYTRDKLHFENNAVKAQARSLGVTDKSLEVGELQEVRLDDFSVIFFRDEPPFDMSYITSTYLLDRVKKDVLFINNPKSVRDFPEKLSALDYHQYMPDTCVASDMKSLEEFLKKNKKSVIKPLHSFGGQDIEIIETIQDLKKHYDSLSLKHSNVPVMLQQYIAKVIQGDKRVILFDGEVIGAINRVPEKNGFKANLAAGGTAQKTTLTDCEYEISRKIAIDLQKADIMFAGIDLIDEYLTEINVTCPTGLVAYNQLHKLEGDDKLEDKMIDRILLKVQNIAH